MKNILSPRLHWLLICSALCITIQSYAQEPAWVTNFRALPLDSEGWSVLTPSSDSRIMYVSTSGNDSSGQIYSVNSTDVGSDIHNPTGNIHPYRTIAAALNRARDTYPDWVLLKKEDTFYETINVNDIDGRSFTERTVITSYGTGTIRPKVIPPVGSDGLNIKSTSFFAMTGIELYSALRDPNSSSFAGFDAVGSSSPKGVSFSSGTLTEILIEDCKISYFGNNLNLSDSRATTDGDITVRRNVIDHAYSTLAHSQGFYAADSNSMKIEENIFYHNGWHRQNVDAIQGDKSQGNATLYNHNLYFPVANLLIIKDNIWLSASSIHNKFTSNSQNGVDSIRASKIYIDNNFYSRGEIVASIAGNDDSDNGYRWQDIYFHNNVATEIGHERPTGRNIGWGVQFDDTQRGSAQNNIFTNYGNNDVTNTAAISIGGHTQNVSFLNNIIYNLISGNGFSDTATFNNPDGEPGHLTFIGNEIQRTQKGPIATINTAVAPISRNNVFWADPALVSANQLFKDEAGRNQGIDYWHTRNESHDPDPANRRTSTVSKIDYRDPSRTFTSFIESLQLPTNTYTSFVEDILLNQRKGSWNPRYSATSINNYFRDGFCHVSDTDCKAISPPNPPTFRNE